MEVDGQKTEFRNEDSELDSEDGRSTLDHSMEVDQDSELFKEGEIVADQGNSDLEVNINRNANITSVQHSGKVDNIEAAKEEFGHNRNESSGQEKRKENSEQEEKNAFFECFSAYMVNKGLFQKTPPLMSSSDAENTRKKGTAKDGPTKGAGKKGNVETEQAAEGTMVNSHSETTIYQEAVKRCEDASKLNKAILENIEEIRKRMSSSSEEDEFVNLSDESHDAVFMRNSNELIDIVGPSPQNKTKGHSQSNNRQRERYVEDGEQLHSSKEKNAAEIRREKVIRDVEQAKARIFEVSGNDFPTGFLSPTEN